MNVTKPVNYCLQCFHLTSEYFSLGRFHKCNECEYTISEKLITESINSFSKYLSDIKFKVKSNCLFCGLYGSINFINKLTDTRQYDYQCGICKQARDMVYIHKYKIAEINTLYYESIYKGIFFMENKKCPNLNRG